MNLKRTGQKEYFLKNWRKFAYNETENRPTKEIGRKWLFPAIKKISLSAGKASLSLDFSWYKVMLLKSFHVTLYMIEKVKIGLCLRHQKHKFSFWILRISVL